MLYTHGVIVPKVNRAKNNPAERKTLDSQDLAYWLSQPADERLAAVEFLRRQYYGRGTAGLRRVVSVLKRP